jgi:hypothetical protein
VSRKIMNFNVIDIFLYFMYLIISLIKYVDVGYLTQRSSHIYM